MIYQLGYHKRNGKPVLKISKMNNRKIKLALTVGLLNKGPDDNALDTITSLMKNFKGVGRYKGIRKKYDSLLNADHVQESFALKFENCTLDLDLVYNQTTQHQYIQGFNLR